MKKIIALIYIVLFFNTITFSQSGWMIQRFNGYFFSINFSDNNTGYLLDDGFILYKTTNCGNNWFHVITNFYPQAYDVISIFFSDNNSGYVSGDNGTIFRTTDGGYNWLMNSIPGIHDVYLYNIKFLNLQTGFAAGYNYILKTTNSGNNWQIYQASIVDNLKSISIVDINTIFVAGDNACFKTINAGVNWNNYYFPDGVNVNGIHFLNTNTGYGVGNDCIVKTTNGGENWFRQYAESSYLLYSNQFINLNTGFANGANGVLLKTTNGGNNWIKQSINVNEDLLSIYFTNNTTGFIAGCNYNGNGIVLKTTDGGNVFVHNESINNPDEYKLNQNYPNPFNPSTKIKFSIPPFEGGQGGMIVLKVYDILGKEIATLVNEKLQPGEYEVPFSINQFSGYQLPSVIYFYTLHAGDYKETKKMLYIK